MTTDEGDIAPEPAIPFKQFLETIHPSVARKVSGLWSTRRGSGRVMNTPELRLHCQPCDGERTFRSISTPTLGTDFPIAILICYLCGDCLKQTKSFSLWIEIDDFEVEDGIGLAYKYGEYPLFGIPVPNKVLRLLGDERQNFLKGRRCENQGLGVGAFAYYRHWPPA